MICMCNSHTHSTNACDQVKYALHCDVMWYARLLLWFWAFHKTRFSSTTYTHTPILSLSHLYFIRCGWWAYRVQRYVKVSCDMHSLARHACCTTYIGGCECVCVCDCFGMTSHMLLCVHNSVQPIPFLDGHSPRRNWSTMCAIIYHILNGISIAKGIYVARRVWSGLGWNLRYKNDSLSLPEDLYMTIYIHWLLWPLVDRKWSRYRICAPDTQFTDIYVTKGTIEGIHILYIYRVRPKQGVSIMS